MLISDDSSSPVSAFELPSLLDLDFGVLGSRFEETDLHHNPYESCLTNETFSEFEKRFEVCTRVWLEFMDGSSEKHPCQVDCCRLQRSLSKVLVWVIIQLDKLNKIRICTLIG